MCETQFYYNMQLTLFGDYWFWRFFCNYNSHNGLKKKNIIMMDGKVKKSIQKYMINCDFLSKFIRLNLIFFYSLGQLYTSLNIQNTNGLYSCADIVNEIMKTRLSYNIWRGLIDILNFDCISIRSLMMICLGIIMKCLSWIVWPSKIVARTLCCRCVFPMHDICRGRELLELRSWPCHFYREECRLQIKWQQRARASGY